MTFFGTGAGLDPQIASPPESPDVVDAITEEAAVCPPLGRALHVTPLVDEGAHVAQGAAVACLRHSPRIRFVAPVAGEVADISLRPGRKLSEIVIYRAPEVAVERYDTDGTGSVAGLRHLMQEAGLWPLLRRRPFGGMPGADEVPAAIVVMATDTRPGAADPVWSLEGREEEFARGLSALARLTDGPVFVCAPPGASLSGLASTAGRVRIARRGPRHPQGSAGICIHQLCPAGVDAPVWDIHAEDAAALGSLVETGVLPMLRRVRITGPALREGRIVRTHPGADLRQLTQRIVAPGPHVTMSGSPLDGHSARWLAPRHRQITVMPKVPARRDPHWLAAALSRPMRGAPAIPTAALTQAFGAALPAAPFLRALGAGDDEGAMRLGLLSLLEEDVALADYVLSEGGRLTAELRALLDRIRTELAA